MRVKEIHGPKQAVARALLDASEDLQAAVDVLTQLRGDDRAYYGPDRNKIEALQQKILDLAVNKYDADRLGG